MRIGGGLGFLIGLCSVKVRGSMLVMMINIMGGCWHGGGRGFSRRGRGGNRLWVCVCSSELRGRHAAMMHGGYSIAPH